MNKNFLLFILIFLPVAVCSGQDVARAKILQLVSKSKDAYAGAKQIQMETTYTLFAGYNSSKVMETYSGQVLRIGEKSYSRIGLTEFFNDRSVSVKTDRESKLIQVESGAISLQASVFDVSQFLGHFDKFNIAETADEWICTMTGPKVTFVPYGKMILHVRKKDYSMSKQVLFLLTQHEYKDKNGNMVQDNPRLELLLSSPKYSGVSGTKLTKSYFVTQRAGKMVPSSNYKGFTIVQ